MHYLNNFNRTEGVKISASMRGGDTKDYISKSLSKSFYQAFSARKDISAAAAPPIAAVDRGDGGRGGAGWTGSPHVPLRTFAYGEGNAARAVRVAQNVVYRLTGMIPDFQNLNLEHTFPQPPLPPRRLPAMLPRAIRRGITLASLLANVNAKQIRKGR